MIGYKFFELFPNRLGKIEFSYAIYIFCRVSFALFYIPSNKKCKTNLILFSKALNETIYLFPF